MNRAAAGLLAFAATVAATAASAAVVNFSFSFTNVSDPFPTVVRGQILGLEDDATGLPTSIRVIDAPYGVGEYLNPDNPFGSSFTVAGGQLVSYVFRSLGESNGPPSQTCCSLVLANALVGFPGNRAALFDFPIDAPPPQVSDLAIAPLIGEPPAPIPLPAPFFMLTAALLALGACARRRSSIGA